MGLLARVLGPRFPGPCLCAPGRADSDHGTTTSSPGDHVTPTRPGLFLGSWKLALEWPTKPLVARPLGRATPRLALGAGALGTWTPSLALSTRTLAALGMILVAPRPAHNCAISSVKQLRRRDTKRIATHGTAPSGTRRSLGVPRLAL